MTHFHEHWRLRTEQDLETWIDKAAERTGASDTSLVVLGDGFDLPPEDAAEEEDDNDVILDPVLGIDKRRATQRRTQKRKQKRKNGTQGQGQSQARSRSDQLVPDVLPTGRISTTAERALGMRQKRTPCRWCGKKAHRSENCPHKRVEGSEDEDEDDDEDDETALQPAGQVRRLIVHLY